MSNDEARCPERSGAPEQRPHISFGLPVRNGDPAIRRCLDSILSQDFDDFEVVVCDNASTDATRAIVEEYAARDPRIRPFFNEENIGQIANVNRVFELSGGEYFRWIGAEDWIEPRYASQCLSAFERDPGVIGVTTYFRIHHDENETRFCEFRGELLESEKPERRFARMLWSFHAGHAVYDPLYGMFRRDAFERTGRIRMMAKADWMMAAELSLFGRFHHVRECLAHRWKPYMKPVDTPDVLRRYRAERSRELRASSWRLFRVLVGIVRSAPLRRAQRVRCYGSALRFFFKESWIQPGTRLERYRRERLGLTRENLFLLLRRMRD